LPHLPALRSLNQPITLDLNGHVIVHSRGEDQARPTELTLTNSRLEGTPLRATMNRKYLERALKLGFGRVEFFGAESPAQCDDGQRQYLWAVLHPNTAIAAGTEPIRIDSPSENSAGEMGKEPPSPRRMAVSTSVVAPPLPVDWCR
jgi:hypothetical protein